MTILLILCIFAMYFGMLIEFCDRLPGFYINGVHYRGAFILALLVVMAITAWAGYMMACINATH